MVLIYLHKRIDTCVIYVLCILQEPHALWQLWQQCVTARYAVHVCV